MRPCERFALPQRKFTPSPAIRAKHKLLVAMFAAVVVTASWYGCCKKNCSCQGACFSNHISPSAHRDDFLLSVLHICSEPRKPRNLTIVPQSHGPSVLRLLSSAACLPLSTQGAVTIPSAKLQKKTPAAQKKVPKLDWESGPLPGWQQRPGCPAESQCGIDDMRHALPES